MCYSVSSTVEGSSGFSQTQAGLDCCNTERLFFTVSDKIFQSKLSLSLRPCLLACSVLKVLYNDYPP